MTPPPGFDRSGSMLRIGQMNRLEIVREAEMGVYMDAGDEGDILLPNRYIPEDWDLGDFLDVFICYDSEDRLIALTEKPYAMVDEFALLKVLAVEEVGAFLDWGLE